MSSTSSLTTAKIYGYAEVGTFGLAHSMLAWARCRVWCNQNDVPMLAPSWLHLQHRIGPLLRREHDNRQYHRLFQFTNYITGLRRLQLLAFSPQMQAEHMNQLEVLRSQDRKLVVFKNKMQLNEETYYPEIVGHGEEVLKALVEMTKPVYRPKPSDTKHIAVHVRMGDFNPAVSVDALRSGVKNSSIPISWYRDVVTTLQQKIGDFPIVVYSDGTDEALASLLQLPGVRRSPKQASVTDLLTMAQAQLVVSSGSGFSKMGAYLANAPRICFPGQRFVRVLGPADNLDLEPECESGVELEPSFLHYVRSKLTSA
jgi:hypothetical protein